MEQRRFEFNIITYWFVNLMEGVFFFAAFLICLFFELIPNVILNMRKLWLHGRYRGKDFEIATYNGEPIGIERGSFKFRFYERL
ncbi:MAG: hypothetical protein MJZ97_00155 [Bacteroidales bacterium]|nr:hypothetical protein [Bacteroidales bacterium]